MIAVNQGPSWTFGTMIQDAIRLKLQQEDSDRQYELSKRAQAETERTNRAADEDRDRGHEAMYGQREAPAWMQAAGIESYSLAEAGLLQAPLTDYFANRRNVEAVGEDGQPIRVNGQPLMVSPDSFLDRVDRLRENPTYSFDSRGRIVENGTEGSLRLPFNVGTTLRQLGQTDTGHTIQREGLDVQRDSNAAQIGLGYAQLRSQERRDAAQLRLQQIVANRSPQVSPSDFMAINAAIDAGVITPEAASAQFNIPLENLQRASRHMYIPPTGGTGTGDPLDNAFGYVRAHGGRFNWRNILPGGKPFFESEEHLSDRDVVEAQQRRYEGVVAALINVETNPVAYRQVLQAQNSTLEAALAGAQNALLRPGLTVEQQADMRRIANYTSALLGRQPPPMMP